MSKQPTVQQLIDSLSEFPMDALVEISVTQYNKSHPVVYLKPHPAYGPGSCDNDFVNMHIKGTVRVHVSLPSQGDKFMYVSERKKK